VLGELWCEVDLALPYSQGEVLARVRERGAVIFEYRDADVRVTGRVPPAMAGELHSVARSWTRAQRTPESERTSDGPHEQEEA